MSLREMLARQSYTTGPKKKDLISQMYSIEDSQFNVVLADEEDDNYYKAMVDKTIEEEDEEIYKQDHNRYQEDYDI